MGDDCSARTLGDLKKGERPSVVVIVSMIFFSLGLYIGYKEVIKIINE